MEAPDKIFISPLPKPSDGFFGIAWADAHGKMDEYIRKDMLIEWAKEEQAKCSSETHPYAMFMNVVIEKLNSL